MAPLLTHNTHRRCLRWSVARKHSRIKSPRISPRKERGGVLLLDSLPNALGGHPSLCLAFLVAWDPLAVIATLLAPRAYLALHPSSPRSPTIRFSPVPTSPPPSLSPPFLLGSLPLLPSSAPLWPTDESGARFPIPGLRPLPVPAPSPALAARDLLPQFSVDLACHLLPTLPLPRCQVCTLSLLVLPKRRPFLPGGSVLSCWQFIPASRIMVVFSCTKNHASPIKLMPYLLVSL